MVESPEEGWSDWQLRVWGGTLELLDAPEQVAKQERHLEGGLGNHVQGGGLGRHTGKLLLTGA